MKECPNCGYTRKLKDDENTPDTECPKCGVIYSKVHSPEKIQLSKNDEKRALTYQPRDEKSEKESFGRSSAFKVTLIVGGVAAVLLLVIVSSIVLTRKGELAGSIFIATKGGNSVKLPLVQVSVHEATKEAFKKISETKNVIEEIKQDHDTKIATFKNEHPELKKREELKWNITLYEGLMGQAKTFTDREHWQEKAEEAKSEYRKFMLAHGDVFERHDQLLKEGMAVEAIPTQALQYRQALGKPLQATKTDADGKFFFTLPRNKDYIISAYGERQVLDYKENYFWLLSFSFEGEKKATIFLTNDNLSTVENPQSLVLLKDYEGEVREMLRKGTEMIDKFRKKFLLE